MKVEPKSPYQDCKYKKKEVDVMLLYHPIRKTYDDFDQTYSYTKVGESGSLYKMQTDKELSVFLF